MTGLTEALDAPADSVAESPVQSVEDIAAAALAAQLAPETNEPSEAPAPEAEPAKERSRAPDGKFAKTDAPAIDKPVADKTPAENEQVAATKTDGEAETSAVRPPPGWSPKSKVDFDALPDHVKADIAKREQEVNQGFAKLAEYKPIERFAEQAKRSGTTLEQALHNYTSMEGALRSDRVAGLVALANNIGVHPVQWAREVLSRYGDAPTQGAAGNGPTANQTAAGDLSPVMAKISQLETYIGQQEQQRQSLERQRIESEIQAFSSNPEHRFFDNVRPQMAQLMSAGVAKDLKDAYERACWADPEIRPLLIKQQPGNAPGIDRAAIATQAKAAAKATIGAPSAGTPPANAIPRNATIEQIAQAALNRQIGRG